MSDTKYITIKWTVNLTDDSYHEINALFVFHGEKGISFHNDINFYEGRFNDLYHYVAWFRNDTVESIINMDN